MTKVFVSSISRGFEEYRQAAIDAVRLVDGMEPVYFESWPAMVDTCQEACLGQVAECDIYLGVLGSDYGRRTQSGMSAVEEEYREAQRLGRRTLLFVQETLLDQDQQRFVASLGEWETAAFRHSHYSPHELRDEVVRALTRELRHAGNVESSPRLSVATAPVLVERGDEGLILAIPAGSAPLSRSSTHAANLVLQGGGAFVHPVKLFLGIECIGSHRQGLSVQQLSVHLDRYSPFADDERVDIQNHTVPQAGGRGWFYLDLIAGFNSLEPHAYSLLRPYWDDEGHRRIPHVVMRDADTIDCLLTVLAPVAGKYDMSVSADLQFGDATWRQVLIPQLRILSLDSPSRVGAWHISFAETAFDTVHPSDECWRFRFQSLQRAAVRAAIECCPFPCQYRDAPELWSDASRLNSDSPVCIKCWKYFGDTDIGLLDAHFGSVGRIKCIGGCPLHDGPEAAHAWEPLPVGKAIFR
ncbi:MAG: DUF4062 domain-containing protein [Pirellulaceae bacterium]